MNSKLISELVSSVSVLVFLCNTIMNNSDKPDNLFCACAIAKFSEKSLKHKKEDTSDIKRDKLVKFQRIVCWMSGKH